MAENLCRGLLSVHANNLPVSTVLVSQSISLTEFQCVVRTNVTVKYSHLSIVETSAAIKN